MALLYICSKIDAYEKTQVIEKTKEEKIEKLKDEIERREEELKKREEEIERRELELKKQTDEYLFISVEDGGIHVIGDLL